MTAEVKAHNQRLYELERKRDAASAAGNTQAAAKYNYDYDVLRGGSDFANAVRDFNPSDYTRNAKLMAGGGYSLGGSYSTGGLQSQLEDARMAQEQATEQRRAAYESALRSQYDTSLGALGQSAAGANTSEYVRYMQNQANLPQQAALMGTGGLSESSLMGLSASYGSNLNAIEQERARGQSSLENQLAQGIAQGEGQYADTMAGISSDYASKLLSLSMQEQANEIARQQALQSQTNWERQLELSQSQWEREFAANQAQLGVTNALNAQKYADSQAKSTSTPSVAATRSSSGGVTPTALGVTPDYGGNTANTSWNNMVEAVSSGKYSASSLLAAAASLTAQYGKDGFAALMSIAR